MKHKEPSFVIAWRAYRPEPKCCHTCEYYQRDGVCAVFDMEPPAEFAATEGECNSWEKEIPF